MLRIRTIFTGVAGTPYYSNLYFDVPAEGAQEATNDVASFWGGCSTYMKNTLTYTVQPEVAVMDEDGTITGVESVTPVSGAGQSASELLPTATQVLLRLTTGVYSGGRAIRGRVFIPGCTEDGAANGLVLGGYASNVANAANTLRTDSAGWSVWSKKNGLIANVSGVSVWNQFAVMRSRRD